jgi:hypothetical protein
MHPLLEIELLNFFKSFLIACKILDLISILKVIFDGQ